MAAAKKPVAKPPVRPRVSAVAAAVAAAGEMGEDRDPQFEPGEHRATFHGLEEKPPVSGHQTWIVGKFELNGEPRVVLFCTGAKALDTTAKRLKALNMALIECESVEDYNAADAHGEFTDGLLGFLESFKSPVLGTVTPSDYIGKEVIVKAVQGQEVKDKPGEFYVNCNFSIAPAAGEQVAE
jgi:hypothetical protein